MAIIEFSMKTHSREDITNEFESLNLCSVHKCLPTIEKVIYGKRKYISYVATCKTIECGRCSDDRKEIVDIWNKWNPNEGDK